MAKILVVDDEESIIRLVKYYQERLGDQVLVARSGIEALQLVWEHKPDLIVLDLMLPEIDGWEVCRHLRKHETTAKIPIIMLTARISEDDKVQGLKLGGDDYVTKPFSPRELAARIEAQLRRHQPTGQEETETTAIIAGPVVIRPDRHEVLIHGQQQELTLKEYELLKHLVLNAGKVLRREYLLSKIWGYDFAVDTRTLDVHIRYLRQKIEPDPTRPSLIETVRGVGYRFREQPV